MIWFVIDASVLMLACFAIGALAAWLLAVALYPRVDEAFADLELGADAP